MDSTRDSSGDTRDDSGDTVEVCDLCGLSVDRDSARYERVGGSQGTAPGDVLTACSEDHMRQLRERQ